MLNSAKICKNGSKITKNVPKMPSIWQYSTVFDFKKRIRFLYETKSFDPIWVPNSEMNTEYF